MKITTILLLSACLSVSAGSRAQKVTLLQKNVKLEKVFKEIRKQTGYVFFYDTRILERAKPVDIHVENVPVEEALKESLRGQPLDFSIEQKTITIFQKADYSLYKKPANVEYPDMETLIPLNIINGTVNDVQGNPLAGVSVIVKGTNKGTSTTANGSFSIDANVGDVLEFTIVGYQKKSVAVGESNNVSVVMEIEATTANEVVVVGYGTVKKQDLTSSISKITSNDFKNQVIPTLSEAFAGQLAGVRAQNSSGLPGSELQIRIRGINSINGNPSPLYVIDGVPMDDMNNINPNDIASIQVLKDASASSIYGSRGGNGVILIETKKGLGKPTLTFEPFFGYQESNKRLDMMNKNEFLAYTIWQNNVNWLRQGGSMKDPMSSRPADMQVPVEWLDPNIKGTNWQDAIMVKAPIQNYQLSASAKNSMGSFYLSGGYLNQDGIIYNTYYKRTNFRFNGVLNISDHIRIGTNIGLSFANSDDRKSEGKEAALHHASLEPPIVEINSGTRDWGYIPGLFLNYPNPLEVLKETISNTRESNINTSVWGEVDILKDLRFKSIFNYDNRTDNYEYFVSGNVAFVTEIPAGNSNSVTRNNIGIQNTLSYDKTFNNHSLNALIGQSSFENESFVLSAGATGWPNDLVSTLNVASTPTLASTQRSKNTGSSFFGRISYKFKDKYLLNASLRDDGSSRFGQMSKWAIFPSVSVGWKINNESFLNNIAWLNLLKIRGAWGKAGNDRIGDYDYLALLKVSNSSWGNAVINGLAPSSLGNEKLKWESTTSIDLGVDFVAFKNRVQVSFDYFNNKTADLLFNVPIPNTTGYQTFRTNIGSVQNKGWELDLRTINTTGKINWSTSFNLSRVKSKVLDMGDVKQFTSTFWGSQFITRIGGPVSQFFVYRTNGLLKTDDFDNNGKALVAIFPGQEPGNVKYIDRNDDSKINSLDLVPYGNNLPDLTYGITNTFQWKKLEFSFLLQGQIGGDVLFLGARNFDAGLTIKFNQFKRWLHAWKPDYEAIYGPGENPVPSIEGVDMTWDGKTPNIFGKKFDDNSDFRIYDATFLRVRNISLSYNLSEKFLRKTVIKSITIYASASNLITFDNNYPGYNVEANNNGLTQAGVDYSTYPLSRKFILGARINF